MNNKSISIVVPVYNEEENVAVLYNEIIESLRSLAQKNSEFTWEVIYINDGSTDNTLEELKKLSPLKIVNFRKNFGQTAALDAGIKEAKGEIVITMDGDGQNDPADIPLILEKLDEGYDVVSGWRHNRKDSLMKKFHSRGANFLRKFLAEDGIHDSGCTFKAYRKECFEGVDLYGEMHRFIPAVLMWHGFKVGEVKVNHRERSAGTTKYNWKRIPKGLLDMLSVWFWRKYANRPLHLFGAVGLFLGGLGSGLLALLLILRAFGAIQLADSVWPLMSVFLVIMGIQFFISGILADISVKNYYKTNREKPYKIREVIEQTQPAESKKQEESVESKYN